MDEIFDICSDVELIFQGGQKKVYQACHPEYGTVALKTGKFGNIRGLERIRREVGFLKSIDSEYFPRNFEFVIDENEGRFLIVEEFIDSQKVSELGYYYNSEEKIVELLTHLVDGLKILWDEKIVHRDLKPDNILIAEDFRPKIIDLGIARFIDYESLTRTIELWGPCTPFYAAPEQLLNKKNMIGMRTDFFSLGIVLLEMHLGYHPFHPDNVGNNQDVVDNIINGVYISPKEKEGTSEEFSYLINRLLRTEQFQRFRNYKVLQDYINECWD